MDDGIVKQNLNNDIASCDGELDKLRKKARNGLLTPLPPPSPSFLYIHLRTYMCVFPRVHLDVSRETGFLRFLVR